MFQKKIIAFCESIEVIVLHSGITQFW